MTTACSSCVNGLLDSDSTLEAKFAEHEAVCIMVLFELNLDQEELEAQGLDLS